MAFKKPITVLTFMLMLLFSLQANEKDIGIQVNNMTKIMKTSKKNFTDMLDILDTAKKDITKFSDGVDAFNKAVKIVNDAEIEAKKMKDTADKKKKEIDDKITAAKTIINSGSSQDKEKAIKDLEEAEKESKDFNITIENIFDVHKKMKKTDTYATNNKTAISNKPKASNKDKLSRNDERIKALEDMQKSFIEIEKILNETLVDAIDITTKYILKNGAQPAFEKINIALLEAKKNLKKQEITTIKSEGNTVDDAVKQALDIVKDSLELKKKEKKLQKLNNTLHSAINKLDALSTTVTQIENAIATPTIANPLLKNLEDDIIAAESTIREIIYGKKKGDNKSWFKKNKAWFLPVVICTPLVIGGIIVAVWWSKKRD